MNLPVILVICESRVLEIADVSLFEDWSVGIGLHVDSYRAIDIETRAEVDDISDAEAEAIDNAIWSAIRLDAHLADGHLYN